MAYGVPNITRQDIAEIHEAIAKRLDPAKSEADQRHQAWHNYSATIIRENANSGPRGERSFTHANRRAM
jgi:hypothetical protein